MRNEDTERILLEAMKHGHALTGPEKEEFFFRLSKLGEGQLHRGEGCEPILNRYRDPHKECRSPGRCRCKCQTCGSTGGKP